MTVRPKTPSNLLTILFLYCPIIPSLFAIAYIAIPINGTINMVTICAKMISCRGSLPKIIAIIAPINSENEAPNKPHKNKTAAYLPNNGANAFAISVALLTLIPLGCDTAEAQINTVALINQSMNIVYMFIEPVDWFFIFQHVFLK
jgi:hypothetical protein